MMGDDLFGGMLKHCVPEEDDLIGSFEVQEDTYLSGLGSTYTRYSDVTDSVCRQLCVSLHSEDCCSIVYIRHSSTCFITPFESNASNVQLRPQTGVNYLRRTKCKRE